MMHKRYQDIRLSDRFVLLDFMYGFPVYASREPLDPRMCVTSENIRNGRYLCETLLEPCIEGWGPCSVSHGFVPEPLATRLPETKPQPHKWVDRFGAAADMCWHKQCAANVAPIDLCHALDRTEGMPYERLMTFAGSEFICMNAKEHAPRYALYENERIDVGQSKFRVWGKDEYGHRLRGRTKYPERTKKWMRAPKEKVTGHALDAPQHHRVGRNFMVLDFCRNERSIALGIGSVTRMTVAIQVMRRYAAILDPVADVAGHLSVTHGGFWPIVKKEGYQLKFLLPVGFSSGDMLDLFPENGEPVDAHFADHPSGTTEVTLRIGDQRG